MILSLITSRLAGPIATGGAVLFLAFGVSQCAGRVSAEKAQARAEKIAAAAKRDLGTCQTNTRTLKVSIDRQNAAVDSLKREGDAKVAESAKAARSARAVAESLRKDAGRILASRVGPDACASADALILGEVG